MSHASSSEKIGARASAIRRVQALAQEEGLPFTVGEITGFMEGKFKAKIRSDALSAFTDSVVDQAMTFIRGLFFLPSKSEAKLERYKFSTPGVQPDVVPGREDLPPPPPVDQPTVSEFQVRVRAAKAGFRDAADDVVLNKDTEVSLSLETVVSSRSLLDDIVKFFTASNVERRRMVLGEVLALKIAELEELVGMRIPLPGDDGGTIPVLFVGGVGLATVVAGTTARAATAGAASITTFSIGKIMQLARRNPEGLRRLLARLKPEVFEAFIDNLTRSPAGRTAFTEIMKVLGGQAAKKAGKLKTFLKWAIPIATLVGLGTGIASLAITIKVAPVFLPHMQKEFFEDIVFNAGQAVNTAVFNPTPENIATAQVGITALIKWIKTSDEIYSKINRFIPGVNTVWKLKVQESLESADLFQRRLNDLSVAQGITPIIPADELVTLSVRITDEAGVSLKGTIWFDNVKQPFGSSAIIKTVPGEHMVWAESTGFFAADPRIRNWEPGEHRIDFTLERPPPEIPDAAVPKNSLLSIDSSPQNANIFVDGKSGFTKTPFTLALAEGQHLIALSLRDFVFPNQFVTMLPGTPNSVFFVGTSVEPPLTIAEVPNAWQFTITVLDDDLVTPLTFKIIVNGVFTGKFTTDNLFLAPDQEFLLRLEKSGFEPIEELIITDVLP